MAKKRKRSQTDELSATDLDLIAAVLIAIGDAIAVLAALKAKEEEEQAPDTEPL